MSRILVWDIPTRVFHWLLAGGFIAAALIALLLGDDSPLFPYHAIIGLTIALMVCLRLVWGFIGTRYARFDSFAFGPRAIAEHLKGALFGGGARYIGHNPASALAIVAMLAMVVALTVTGIMLGQGNESVKDIHEVFAYIMVGVVVAHILGVVVHTIRHRENIVAGMIHGMKDAHPADAIRSTRPVAAVIFLVVSAAWTAGLVRNFDPATQTTTLPIVGTSLQVGDAENEQGTVRRDGEYRRHDDDD